MVSGQWLVDTPDQSSLQKAVTEYCDFSNQCHGS